MSEGTRQVRLAGPFQQLVMLALIRIGPDCHGGAIHRYIEARTGRWTSLKAVYTTLMRLEQKGHVRSWKRAPLRWRWSPDRNRPGPRHAPRAARRFYTAATPGIHAVRQSCQATDRMRPGLPGMGREDELYRMYSHSRSPRPFAFRNQRLREKYGMLPRSDPHWLRPICPEWALESLRARRLRGAPSSGPPSGPSGGSSAAGSFGKTGSTGGGGCG
jgi:PadR family transcriptional regulator, regulatory protein PadR